MQLETPIFKTKESRVNVTEHKSGRYSSVNRFDDIEDNSCKDNSILSNNDMMSRSRHLDMKK